MNELLTALQAAAKVGFDAPKCGGCRGSGRLSQWEEFATPLLDPPCPRCTGSGLDASDPEKLIGRAHFYLQEKGLLDSSRRLQTWSSWDGGPNIHEEHDGTPAGLATVLLRLVARVGGKQ